MLASVPNVFKGEKITSKDLEVKEEGKRIRVIVASDGSLATQQEYIEAKIQKGIVKTDIDQDVLKIVVLNRYENARPSIGFIRGFGMHTGAIASSVSHDSHNIVSVGVRDEEIAAAMNYIIENRGGIVAYQERSITGIPLPIGGIMSAGRGNEVSGKYEELNQKVQKMGSGMKAPFMTLSFMSLLVIPELKIGDRGLFDVTRFEPASLFV